MLGSAAFADRMQQKKQKKLKMKSQLHVKRELWSCGAVELWRRHDAWGVRLTHYKASTLFFQIE